jgi:hypothetical protein
VRGLAESALEEFGIGYASKGIMRGCIAIPIHNAEGELVAYAGRRLKPQQIRDHGKYKFPKGFHKSVELYNLHRAREHLVRGLILVEGFFAAVHVSEAGFPNVVAAMGSELSRWQAELIADAPEVIILFDGDDAGRAGSHAARNLLAEHTTVRVITLPEDKSPDDLGPRVLRWLVNARTALARQRHAATRAHADLVRGLTWPALPRVRAGGAQVTDAQGGRLRRRCLASTASEVETPRVQRTGVDAVGPSPRGPREATGLCCGQAGSSIIGSADLALGHASPPRRRSHRGRPYRSSPDRR